jgi:NDP-sugar pyrophosphorylase family protein
MPSAGAVIRDGVLIGRDAVVDPGATVVAPSCIGSGSSVGAGATVERSILWSGAKIGARARVSDAVIGTGVSVEAGAVVEGGEHATATPTR